jgi:hypothetical protein
MVGSSFRDLETVDTDIFNRTAISFMVTPRFMGFLQVANLLKFSLFDPYFQLAYPLFAG